MSQRNTKEFLNKGVDVKDWNAGMHCLAIVSKGSWHMNWKAFEEINIMEEKTVSPLLHHTFLVVRPWISESYTWEKLGWGQKVTDLIDDIESSGIKSYSIVFHKLVFTRHGILMIGTPDKDVNRWRDNVRCKQVQRGVISGEVYYNNIFHATLLRWSKELTPQEILMVARMIDRLNKKYDFFARIDVYGYQIVNATWLLKEDTVEVFTSRDFEDVAEKTI